MVLSKSRNNPSGDGQGEGHEGQVSRPSIYMSREIEIELEAQADIDRTSKSRVITDVFELLLLTPIGQSLRQKAKQNNQTLAQELADVLAEFEKIPTEQIAQLSEASRKTPLQMLTYLLQEIPTEEIAQLARASQRPPINMIVHLVLLGLRVYKRYLARMDQAIDESAID